MRNNLILLFCVFILLASLLYVSDLAGDFIESSVSVHCRNAANYQKCKDDFLLKVHTEIKERR